MHDAYTAEPARMVAGRRSRQAERQARPSYFITREEGQAILDEQARRSLGMSGADFARAWRAGKIKDPDRPEVMHVAMLLPLAR